MKNRIIALAASLPITTLGFAGVALAGDDVTVINSNSAYVKNVVSSKADSGDNWAGGSTGGNGGNGGSVSNAGVDNDAKGNTTGAAGNGGAAGFGGSITTGGALSTALVENHVNSNETEVDACGCEEEPVVEEPSGEGVEVLNENGGHHGDDVFVMNKNRARVKNYVSSKADSGDNSADGSTGGNGGNGGSVSNAGKGNDADDNTTGPAGNGGTGSEGGLIQTGAANSLTGVVNYVNRNITRITR
ncbi:MAG: hypothetical protein COU90_02390 [Candidatus Ryanbacteria bacterium CG10_big_fil_rev_8_21_14_0_10_43_42]|uniref:PE-PGRS family protein n=1 Tax=Candidatus Ryanbacteria bacterium CG10_big_fil_rev_8_21_14_0_10_43_42 TaxID=1974864 RepID=A0A2M8KXK6_9BACT|nr:MAG: hypothetical protein COU90_02390 [Candidatus Ryanbacteria bacterium CG10_big_fil_rev_8_21_14_0_10_43_42]